MKTIVVLQGGGALGAYACGAWQALAPLLREQGAVLAATGGASIGALNAAIVARHHADADWGVAALASLWRERLATPSLPLAGYGELPWPGSPPSLAHGEVSSWNGVLTGLCAGTRGLCRPQVAHLQAHAALHRVHMPLFDRTPLLQTLQSLAPSYRSAPGAGPMLCIAATDLMGGELHLFDSDRIAITPEHLAASSAIPVLFEPVTIDGTLYCDGDMVRHSMLPLVMERGRHAGRWQDDEPLQLVTVEQIPQRLARRPETGLELLFRAMDLMQLDKLDSAQLHGVNLARVVRIRREGLPDDAISGQFDFSPARIETLIAQGERDAAAAWQAAGQPNPARATA